MPKFHYKMQIYRKVSAEKQACLIFYAELYPIFYKYRQR